MSNMTGIFVPIEVLSDNNLNINEKLILSLVKNMKSLYMSNKTLSDLLGISKSRVSHIITSLNQKGYVDVELTYTEEKQVEKRTVTLKKVVEVIQETVKRAVSKAKEIKKEVQADSGRNTYKKIDKKSRFNNIASHNWNFDTLEAMEQEHIDGKVEEFNLEELQSKLKRIRGAD